MNNDVEQVLIGSILGDGSIGKAGFYHEGHCEAQKDWLFWKRRILKKEFKIRMRYVITNKEKWTKQNQYHLSSRVSPFLKEYRQLSYPNGKKTITDEFIKRIGKLAIVVWYFDDGSYNAWKNGIQIHSMCFSLEENQKLQRMLKNRFGLNFRIGCVHKKTDYPYYLFCYGKDTDNFLEFIKKNALYIPKSMTYKLGKLHKRNLNWIQDKIKAIQIQRHNYRQKNRERLKKIDHDYYQKNAKRERKKRKIYYQENKEKWIEYTRRRREHPEKLKEMYHNYYIKNKKRIRIRDRKYYVKNRERIQKLVLDKINNGLCVSCGEKNDSIKAKYLCTKCSERKKIRELNRRNGL